jgi:very-short-patch-repair endonuclease
LSKLLTVKINDLQKRSNVKIDVLCDYCCEEILTMTYDQYTQRTKEINKIACRNCYTQKVKEVCLLKYGVDSYAKTKECREKYTKTMLDRYGVKHNSQLPDYREKFHNTCIERYGESYGKQFIEKALETFANKTGYHYSTQSPEIQEKIKQSCLDRFGYEYSLQSPEIRKKIVQTLYAHSSQKVSKQQRHICELYRGILNFPVECYNAYIYLADDNLIIEYDGGGHMLNVITEKETMEEYTKKEIVRNAIIKEHGYKQIHIISSNDRLPSDDVLIQLLLIAKNYFNTTSHSWIKFDIDNSKMINAENKNIGGAYFDFGQLRKIK